ncbi:hypothetical protein LZ30DRAFT_52898 [Colletotrichum cereale]|nr:hypothetical protein LZ30DRAFT_52898 [Colletotrichum cereale]
MAPGSPVCSAQRRQISKGEVYSRTRDAQEPRVPFHLVLHNLHFHGTRSQDSDNMGRAAGKADHVPTQPKDRAGSDGRTTRLHAVPRPRLPPAPNPMSNHHQVLVIDDVGHACRYQSPGVLKLLYNPHFPCFFACAYSLPFCRFPNDSRDEKPFPYAKLWSGWRKNTCWFL